MLAIETAAFRAWPAARVQELGGWRLRFHWNLTGRANSVWPGAAFFDSEQPAGPAPARSLEARLAMVDDFYFGWGQTPRFQISPVMDPPDLCDHLARHGYEQRSGGRVQIASLDDLLLADQGTGPAPATPAGQSHGVQLDLLARPDEEWYALQRRIMGLDAVTSGIRRTILERIPAPAAFARCWVDGAPAAIGVGVLDVPLGLLGIFGMATAPECRRRGAATAILRGFSSWARSLAGTHAYLQVAPANEVALRLYAGLGFRDSHGYDYWVKEEPGS